MKIVELNEAAFDATVGTGVTLVDFWATYCGPCKMMGALLESQIAPQLGDAVKICKVDVASEPALAARLDILSIPALLIYKNGTLMTRLDGLQKPNDVIEAVKAVMG